jgi:hypothetical protein
MRVTRRLYNAPTTRANPVDKDGSGADIMGKWQGETHGRVVLKVLGVHREVSTNRRRVDPYVWLIVRVKLGLNRLGLNRYSRLSGLENAADVRKHVGMSGPSALWRLTKLTK